MQLQLPLGALILLFCIPSASVTSLAFSGQLLPSIGPPSAAAAWRRSTLASGCAEGQTRRAQCRPLATTCGEPLLLRRPGRRKISHLNLAAPGDGAEGDVVEEGDVVQLHYLGELEDLEEFDSTFEREPIEFEVGSGRVIPGIDAAVLGMRVGDIRDVIIDCEDAFGLRRASRLLNISIANLPPEPYIGQLVGIKGIPAVVSKVWRGLPVAEVDANHPLAGEDLHMTLKVEGITKARDIEQATFAGGPFWGLEIVFQRIPGVLSTQAGYTGGHTERPTYAQVCTTRTGHAEAVLVKYRRDKCSYADLLRAFFSNVDVTTANRQRTNVGPMYRSGIYWHTEEQRVMALEAMAGAELLIKEQRGRLGPGEGPNGQYVVAELRQNVAFWRAEERHQQFLEKLGQLATKGADDPIVCFTDSGAGVVERERPDRGRASADQALLDDDDDDDDDDEMGGFPEVETIEWEDVQAIEAKARCVLADEE